MHTDEKSRWFSQPVPADEASRSLPGSDCLSCCLFVAYRPWCPSALPLQQHHVLHTMQELQEEAELRHRDKRKAIVKLQKVLPPHSLLGSKRVAALWPDLLGMSRQTV